MVRSGPVRILLDYRPALRQRTGVGEFAHELARALARLDTDDSVAILTTSWKDRPPAYLTEDLSGVRIVDRRLPVRPLSWSWNRLGWPPVEWLAGPVDVVHAQSPLLIPATRAARIITIHDLDFLRHPERAEAEMRRDFPALVAQHAARADHIVVSSHYTAREVTATLNIAREQISVCSPGVPSWSASVAQARARGSRGDSILFVGTLEPRKNISGLLDAYTMLRAAQPDAPPLILAGRARSSLANELNRISVGPLAGHVQQLGYVSDQQKQDLYRNARFLVLPSLEEGFGLPVLEAMACGVPVVVSNRGSLPEVAGAAATPVDANDTRALATAMAHLLDRSEASAASARGLAEARRYSWETCARTATEAYRAAIARRAERRG